MWSYLDFQWYFLHIDILNTQIVVLNFYKLAKLSMQATPEKNANVTSRIGKLLKQAATAIILIYIYTI